MPRLFDYYIMVDWSAAASPKTGKDSIWIAVLDAGTGRTTFSNPATRTKAFDQLSQHLERLTSSNKRVLLGFDFSLGYPRGTAKAFGLRGNNWRALHSELAARIIDQENNANNRFEIAAQLNQRTSNAPGPFWGVTSKRHVTETLSAQKDSSAPLPEYRIVERFLRNQKLRAPKSVWQLAYIGSVGSQSLMGIPYVEKLRTQFPSAKLWPFETGFEALSSDHIPGGAIIIAEIYPSLVKATPKNGECLDKAQVRAMARHYWEMDKSGTLGAAFAPPSQLNAANISNINKEEGWILGITPINIGNLAS